MNEIDSDLEHVQKVRQAMSSGSRSRALMAVRARDEIRTALEPAPPDTDAFKIANELSSLSTKCMGRVVVWDMFISGELEVDNNHHYTLPQSVER